MRVVILNVYSEERRSFSGTADEVKQQVFEAYPFVSNWASSLRGALQYLDRCQAYVVVEKPKLRLVRSSSSSRSSVSASRAPATW